MPGYTHNLQMTSMFICMPKTNSIIHFFSQYISLKNPEIWLAESILDHNSRTNFSRYGIGGEISITILVFVLDYFQEKVIKFFKKSKKSYSGATLSPFCPNLDNNEFSRKKESVFKYSNYL